MKNILLIIILVINFDSLKSQPLKLTIDESIDLAIENKYNFAKYYSPNENAILSFKLFAQSINSIAGEDVRVSKRIYIPGSRLRGFEKGKIGPKDGNQYIGGNYGAAVNLNTTLPNILYGYENLDFNLFIDAANIWGVDYDSSVDENSKIRSSTGIALDWFTPIGPLNFSFAKPITKASTDKTEKFRFNLGTTF